MNRSGITSIVLTLSIMYVIFYVPFSFTEGKYGYLEHRVIDHFMFFLKYKPFFLILYLPFFFPIYVLIEANTLKDKHEKTRKAIYALHCFIIPIGGFFIWMIMVFNLTGPKQYFKVNFYFILVYLIIGLIWSIRQLNSNHLRDRLIYNKLSLTKTIHHTDNKED